jgi:hypothetical protein
MPVRGSKAGKNQENCQDTQEREPKTVVSRLQQSPRKRLALSQWLNGKFSATAKQPRQPIAARKRVQKTSSSGRAAI